MSELHRIGRNAPSRSLNRGMGQLACPSALRRTFSFQRSGGTPRAIIRTVLLSPTTEAVMTQTLTLPRRPQISPRQTAERVLRDVAFVLHLSERIGREIRGGDRLWPVISPRLPRGCGSALPA